MCECLSYVHVGTSYVWLVQAGARRSPGTGAANLCHVVAENRTWSFGKVASVLTCWAIGWLILIASLLGSGINWKTPLNRSWRTFPGRIKWGEKTPPQTGCHFPQHPRSKEVQGKGSGTCFSALIPNWHPKILQGFPRLSVSSWDCWGN